MEISKEGEADSEEEEVGLDQEVIEVGSIKGLPPMSFPTALFSINRKAVLW